jgi:fibronectin-binding autotransporter adhesin
MTQIKRKPMKKTKLSRANPLTRFFALSLLLLIGALLRTPSAFAQTISYANPANVAPTLTSSSGSADLTISTGTISVGDMIKLGATVPTGFTANTSLGRVYNGSATAATLTVGVANGSGNFAGVIGKDFPGTGGGTISLTKIGSGTQTISGVIAGTGAVTVNGAGGSLILSGADTYTGTTTISAGTLLVNGTHVGGGNYLVNGGTLGGTGTITPKAASGITMNSGGILAPGASIGTLTLDGVTSASTLLTFASGANLSFELGAGNTSDTLKIVNAAASDVSFTSTVIDFTDLTSGSLSSGAYLLFDLDLDSGYSGLTEDGSGFITAGLGIGTGLGSYSSTLQQVGQDIFLNIAAVPEPSTAALFVGGVLMLFGFQSRKLSG